MGRLDDAAKRKVVELRKTGLSFRKIKAVLELDNIEVSAQAIYLYLRELQGGPTGRVRPVAARGSTTIAQLQGGAGQIQVNWNNVRHKNLFHEKSHHFGLTASLEVTKQPSLNPETCTKPPGNEEVSRRSRTEQQHEGDKEENSIQIVSVTSLAQNNPSQNAPQSSVGEAESCTGTSTSTSSEAFMRRRVTASPATNSIWAARKRLLDKALSHRMKHSITKGASWLRKDHFSVQDSSVRNAVPQRTDTYDLTTEKTVMENQRGEGTAPKRFLTQRPGLVLRSPYTPPRVGVRLSNRPPVPSPPAAPAGAIARLQTVGCQGATHSEKNQGPPQTGQDMVVRGGLQDQIQTLGSEVRSLALAVKMLVEQQHRLEREQAEQTHLQKQILSTLQGLSTKVGQSSSSQTEHNKTLSPSALPTTSTSTTFNQGDFNFSQGTYTACSQTEAGYNSVDSLQSVEAFKLPRQSPLSMNGFSPCSKSKTFPLTHTQPQSQAYVAAYGEQTLMHSCVQSYVPSYDQSHPQSFRMSEDKTADYQSSCSATQTLQDCSGSMQVGLTFNHTGGQQLTNAIKAEGP